LPLGVQTIGEHNKDLSQVRLITLRNYKDNSKHMLSANEVRVGITIGLNFTTLNYIIMYTLFNCI